MGVEYLTPEEIKHNQDEIKASVTDHPSYFTRTGDIIDIVQKY